MADKSDKDKSTTSNEDSDHVEEEEGQGHDVSDVNGESQIDPELFKTFNTTDGSGSSNPEEKVFSSTPKSPDKLEIGTEDGSSYGASGNTPATPNTVIRAGPNSPFTPKPNSIVRLGPLTPRTPNTGPQSPLTIRHDPPTETQGSVSASDDGPLSSIDDPSGGGGRIINTSGEGQSSSQYSHTNSTTERSIHSAEGTASSGIGEPISRHIHSRSGQSSDLNATPPPLTSTAIHDEISNVHNASSQGAGGHQRLVTSGTESSIERPLNSTELSASNNSSKGETVSRVVHSRHHETTVTSSERTTTRSGGTHTTGPSSKSQLGSTQNSSGSTSSSAPNSTQNSSGSTLLELKAKSSPGNDTKTSEQGTSVTTDKTSTSANSTQNSSGSTVEGLQFRIEPNSTTNGDDHSRDGGASVTSKRMFESTFRSANSTPNSSGSTVEGVQLLIEPNSAISGDDHSRDGGAPVPNKRTFESTFKSAVNSQDLGSTQNNSGGSTLLELNVKPKSTGGEESTDHGTSGATERTTGSTSSSAPNSTQNSSGSTLFELNAKSIAGDGRSRLRDQSVTSNRTFDNSNSSRSAPNSSQQNSDGSTLLEVNVKPKPNSTGGNESSDHGTTSGSSAPNSKLASTQNSDESTLLELNVKPNSTGGNESSDHGTTGNTERTFGSSAPNSTQNSSGSTLFEVNAKSIAGDGRSRPRDQSVTTDRTSTFNNSNSSRSAPNSSQQNSDGSTLLEVRVKPYSTNDRDSTGRSVEVGRGSMNNKRDNSTNLSGALVQTRVEPDSTDFSRDTTESSFPNATTSRNTTDASSNTLPEENTDRRGGEKKEGTCVPPPRRYKNAESDPNNCDPKPRRQNKNAGESNTDACDNPPPSGRRYKNAESDPNCCDPPPPGSSEGGEDDADDDYEGDLLPQLPPIKRTHFPYYPYGTIKPRCRSIGKSKDKKNYCVRTLPAWNAALQEFYELAKALTDIELEDLLKSLSSHPKGSKATNDGGGPSRQSSQPRQREGEGGGGNAGPSDMPPEFEEAEENMQEQILEMQKIFTDELKQLRATYLSLKQEKDPKKAEEVKEAWQRKREELGGKIDNCIEKILDNIKSIDETE